MNSWFVWIAFALVAIVPGWIAYCFSLRVLRVTAAIVALVTAAYLTWYGLTDRANPPGGLSDAFARGADALVRAFFHLPPVPPGPHVPGLGWIGLLVIVILLVIGYRELEALSQHCHARYLDTSELTRARQNDRSGDGKDARTDVQRHDQQTDPSGDGMGALTDEQRHDRLAAALKFWLPAVEVRAPAIFPGGSRSGALASIAEASGVNGSGLAGAVIRFFGMLWPSPRRVRVRVWVEGAAVPTRVDAPAKVAVCLDDPGTGESIGTKTLAAENLDKAACVAAGYVARRIFAGDPTVPPWSIGTADGADLAAMLLARHERVHPASSKEVNDARKKRISVLEKVAWSSQCAGVARYELAHLYDLQRDHVKALALHAANREQYKRFYRGRYRLAMSLEMATSLDPGTMSEEERDKFNDVLRILDRWDGTVDEIKKHRVKDGKLVLRSYLLEAAQSELEEIGRYLTLRYVIGQSFRHRNERGVLKPYWRLRHRQSFHDGVCFAQLLVAVRQTLNDKKNAPPLTHQKVQRIATTIAGDSSCIAKFLEHPDNPVEQPEHKNLPPMDKRLRTRRWPWQYSTPSWPAAYNLACVYAAIYAYRNHQLKACMREPENKQAKYKADQIRELRYLMGKVVTSLEFAINNPECEMDRPSEWIKSDPDLGCLRSRDGEFPEDFKKFLDMQEQRDYPPSTTQDGADSLGQPGRRTVHNRFWPTLAARDRPPQGM